MRNDPPPNISAAPIDDQNLLCQKVTIKGPPDSPYEGGEFHLIMKLTSLYPETPPLIKFLTQVYHPNICFFKDLGSICLSILDVDWSPNYTISQALLAIYCLLTDPNPDDPMKREIAKLYKENREEYNKRARNWTQKYALPNSNSSSLYAKYI